MADEKIQMPSGMGGLVRYFDDAKSRISLKPEHIVAFIVLFIIVEITLHAF